MMKLRVFVVQKADQETGQPIGEPFAAKLTRGAAQALAKRLAPCRITSLWADKSEDLQQQPTGSRLENEKWVSDH